MSGHVHRTQSVVLREAAAGWILLIDPHDLTRSFLAALLRRWGMAVHESPGPGPDAGMDGNATRADGCLLALVNIASEDVRAPDVRRFLDGLMADLPGVPVTVLSGRDDSASAMEAVRLGLRGYLPASVSGPELVAAVRLIIGGGIFIGGGALPMPSVAPDGAALTAREAEVHALLRQGKSNKIIAYELGMAENTVKVHVRRILRKLKAGNRTEVAFRSERPAAGTAIPLSS